MSETTAQKQSKFAPIVNVFKQHKTKILAGVAVTSVTVNVLQARGLSAHNAFLKEHGLFEQFYELTSTEA